MKPLGLLCLVFFFSPAVCASDWLSRIASDKQLDDISAIYARAEVSVSDGKKYKVETVWLDQERALFHRQYPDRRVTMGREGYLYWSYDGTKQTDLTEEYRHFIVGHQYHAHLLFSDQFDMVGERIVTSNSDCECMRETSTDVDGNIISIEYELNGLPLRQITESERFGTIMTHYQDWRLVSGVQLPHKIVITHDKREFVYLYDTITFNEQQHFRRLSAEMSQLTDEQQILRLHRLTMDAHIASDAELMEDNWAENILIVNRGEHIQTTGEVAAKRMASSLSNRTHSKYIDLVKPHVTLSADGTVGWLAVQVYAEGVTRGEDAREFDFTSAWIATFEKINGAWKMTANASNFKPG